MNDPRLEQLLRAAREAEAFEADVLGRRGPSLRLTEAGPEEREALVRAMTPKGAGHGAGRHRFTSWGWRAGIAAAACVTVGWFLSMSFSGPSGGPPGVPAPTAGGLASAERPRGDAASFRPRFEGLRPRSPEPAVTLASYVPQGDQVAQMVVAIFRDSQGGCPCIHMQPHALADGRSIDQLTAEELANIRLKGACASTGDSLLLVALEGPGDLLPRTAAQAEALADCVGDAPRMCDGSPGCMASMAAGCLDPSVKVVAHSVRLASR